MLTPELADVQAGRLLKSEDFDAYEEAKHAGYVIRNGRSWDLANAYYRWCCASGRPYVRIDHRQKYADVHLDPISLEDRLGTRQLDEEHMLQVKEVMERSLQEMEHAGAPARRRAGYRVASGSATFESIPAGASPALARALFEIGDAFAKSLK